MRVGGLKFVTYVCTHVIVIFDIQISTQSVSIPAWVLKLSTIFEYIIQFFFSQVHICKILSFKEH